MQTNNDLAPGFFSEKIPFPPVTLSIILQTFLTKKVQYKLSEDIKVSNTKALLLYG